MLDLFDINLMRTIADVGSISKAAVRLNMSQPTLSKRLNRLEHQLGLTLFHRSNDGMLATDAARYIISSGESLDKQIRVIARHIELLAMLQEGVLNIGVGPIVEQIFFPQVLLDFTKATRSIRLTIKLGTSRQMLAWLNNGEIDVAFGPFDGAHISDGLHAQLLMSEELIAIVRQGHPLAKGQPNISLDALLSYPCIGPSLPDHMRAALDGLIEPGLIDQLFMITCDNYVTCKSVVQHSDYFSIGPERLFAEEIQNGLLIRLALQPTFYWSAYCLNRPESMHLPVVKKINEIFLGHAAKPLT